MCCNEYNKLLQLQRDNVAKLMSELKEEAANGNEYNAYGIATEDLPAAMSPIRLLHRCFNGSMGER